MKSKIFWKNFPIKIYSSQALKTNKLGMSRSNFLKINWTTPPKSLPDSIPKLIKFLNLW